jgi:hypothetical protein
MKKMGLLAVIISIQAVVCLAQAEKTVKITAEEIVAKHLASIGTPEDIAAIKSRVFIGDATISNPTTDATAPVKNVATPVQFASAGQKLILAILAADQAKPPIKIAYDGKEQTSNLSDKDFLGIFLRGQKAITQDGFLGGVLSSAWPLLDLKTSKVKLTTADAVEVNGKSFYTLKYSPSAEVNIFLYFETDTFRHMGTEYEYTTAQSSTKLGSSVKVQKYRLTEVFADFKKAGKLTLPFQYKIKVSSQDTVISPMTGMGRGLPYESQDTNINERAVKSLVYVMNFKDVYYDEVIDPGVFRVQ